MAQTTNTVKKIINLELSIQISLSGLSFCILQKKENKVSFLKHVDFDKKLNPFEVLDNLKNCFDSEEELQQEFSAVNVIHTNEISTLVPKPLFKEDCLADYLKFNSKILKSDFISFDDIKINDSVNIYVPYVNINNYIYEKFGAFIYKHFSTILIDNILLAEKKAETLKIYVHVDKGHFEILVLNKGKLTLYNTFEYSTKEDFIYYILFTCEQLQLNPETIDLILLGNITKDDEFYNIAYKYVRHVTISDRPDNITLEGSFTSNKSDYILLNSF